MTGIATLEVLAAGPCLAMAGQKRVLRPVKRDLPRMRFGIKKPKAKMKQGRSWRMRSVALPLAAKTDLRRLGRQKSPAWLTSTFLTLRDLT
jgi:hypothetical protein